MKLIDKEKVVAEIERRKHKLLDHIMFERDKEWVVRTAHQLNRIIFFLDDLEVKEVDLDIDIRTYLTNHFNIYEDGVLQSKKSGLPLRTYDIIKVAKHFFELGLKAKEE